MLFRDGEHPVKFFIQRDLLQDVLLSLMVAIRDEGGVIVTKVPIRGYVLTQPGTEEAERLSTSWKSNERPHRCFVPYAWVNECRRKGRMVQQIFIEKGVPVKMHIHGSIANLTTRDDLAQKISVYGGDPTVSENEAAVIIATSQIETTFVALRKKCQGNTRQYVEDIKWLDLCIGQEMYYHSPNPKRNPGGRRPGEERTSFTDEDELNLCSWIASVIPHKETGGRTGNKIYQDLVAKAKQPGFEWVERHTWQSWRERYKKHATRLDKHIEAIVNLHGRNFSASSTEPNTAQYGFFRLTSSRRRKRDRKSGESESPSPTEPVQIIQSVLPFADENTPMVEGSTVASPTEDEVPIREGNAPQPTWARRLVPEDFASGNFKRPRSGPSTTNRSFVIMRASNFATIDQRTSETAPTYTSQMQVDDQRSDPPINDQVLQTIASDFEFSVNDVRNYYARTKDLAATKQRFERMRVLMNTMP